jgi:hypothetical protein
MTHIRRFASALALTLFALAVSARAQTPTIEVTTDNDAAEFSTQGGSGKVHVEVYSPSGELVFEMGQGDGQSIRWQMLNQKGERVPDGVYLATVTVVDSSGKKRKRIEQITVGGQPTDAEAAAAGALAPQDSLAPTGSGTAGKLAKWTTTTNIGNSVLTESAAGNVGVNIAAPAAVLHVNRVKPAPVASNAPNAPPLLQTSGGFGGDTTVTGAVAGNGSSISLAAGNGGAAPAGSKNGSGGNITLQPGSAGGGAGTAGVSGNVLIAPSGVGNVAIGTASTASSRLTVGGRVQTVGAGNGLSLGAGGNIKFADGSVQTTAALPAVQHNATLAGAGTAASPLAVANLGVGAAQLANSSVTALKVAPGQVVKSLNGLKDTVTLAAGSNVTITPSGQTLTVAAVLPAATSSNTPNTLVKRDASGDFSAGTVAATVLSAFSEYWLAGARLIGGKFTDGNLFVGQGAGEATTPNNPITGYGIRNTFVGVGAGQTNKTGHTNTFYGFEAGSSNFTGSFNTFVGRLAGAGAETGSSNTFLGNQTRTENSAVSYSTAIGAGAVVSTDHTIVLGTSNEKVLLPGNVSIGAGPQAPPVRPLEITSGQLYLSSLGGSGDIEYREVADQLAWITTSGPDSSLPAFRVFKGVEQTQVFTVFNDGNAKVQGTLEVVGGSCTGCSPPSDRNLKANISMVNPRAILQKLAAIPIQAWNYKSEGPSVRHVGPMAQDFREAFGLGKDDKTLNTVDAQGVTMAAVQALYQQNQELARKLERLQAQLNQMRRAVRRKRASR